jgi:UDP-glucose 4-epimerase
MNVLVVGGCGFIGSNLVKRLLVRKHLVSVIDIKEPCTIQSLEEGVEYYKADAASTSCNAVFETGHFDTVVYAAGTAFGKKDIEYGSEFSALVNILNMCVEFGVKNFIYISTAFLNSYQPIPGDSNAKSYPGLDIYCANKMMEEYYCSVYDKLYNLKTSIIRLPQVYGPGQDVFGEGGIILRILKSSMQNENSIILVHGNILELSYINDVSEKLYDLIHSEESGVFGYRGNRIEVDVLLSKISELIDKIKIEVVCNDQIDISPSEGTRLINMIEENSTIDFGLYKTHLWFLSLKDSDLEPTEEKLSTNKKKNRKMLSSRLLKGVRLGLGYLHVKVIRNITNIGKSIFMVTKKLFIISSSKRKSVGMQLKKLRKKHINLNFKKYKRVVLSVKRTLPWMENILLCLLAVWISDRISLTFDPKLICIMIIGLFYGVVHSVIAIFLCTGFSYLLFANQYVFEANLNVLETTLVYFFIALISGFVTTSKALENKKLSDSYARLEQLYLKIRKDFSDKRKAASIMAEQIRTTENNYGKILDIIKMQSNLTVDEILMGIPDIVLELTGFKDIELYMAVDEGKKFDYYCCADSENKIFELKQSIHFNDENSILEVLNKGNIYINTLQNDNVPGVIIPLLNNNAGKLAGIISIKYIPFMKLSVNTEYMLHFLGEFLSNRYSNSARSIQN